MSHEESSSLPSFTDNEAFLEDSLSRLTLQLAIAHQLKEEQEIEKNQMVHEDYYTFTKEEFNDLFPFSYDFDPFKENFYVGQIIRSQRKTGIGTGILIEIQKENNKLYGLGITALHTFLDFKDGSLNFSAPGSFTFIQGQKSIQGNEETSNFHSQLIINKIYFSIDPYKDFCIFKGVLKPNQAIYRILEEFDEVLQNFSFPSITNEEISLEESVEAHIYHYPLGKTERINTGALLQNSDSTKAFHNIDTLFGSSGAPLFVNSCIVGLHLGVLSSSISKNKIVLTPSNFLKERLALYVASRNRFVKISKKYYDDMRKEKGLELYRLILDSSDEDNEEAKRALDRLTCHISRSHLVKDAI